MIYIASPYTHPDPWIMEERYLAVLKATAEAVQAGLFVYSPIVHCHDFKKVAKIQAGFEYFRDFDLHVISLCEKVLVCNIEGWRESIGVTAELEYARSKNIPVDYIFKGFLGEVL